MKECKKSAGCRRRYFDDVIRGLLFSHWVQKAGLGRRPEEDFAGDLAKREGEKDRRGGKRKGLAESTMNDGRGGTRQGRDGRKGTLVVQSRFPRLRLGRAWPSSKRHARLFTLCLVRALATGSWQWVHRESHGINSCSNSPPDRTDSAGPFNLGTRQTRSTRAGSCLAVIGDDWRCGAKRAADNTTPDPTSRGRIPLCGVFYVSDADGCKGPPTYVYL